MPMRGGVGLGRLEEKKAGLVLRMPAPCCHTGTKGQGRRHRLFA